ncbi:MAG: hypothetical protein H6710_20970 [Myxococcales bacterium]|nr:hypothetical protein [Myxococcales bacterium]MCB9706463.1 hypothetical protein [Myxococcales bacterium]
MHCFSTEPPVSVSMVVAVVPSEVEVPPSVLLEPDPEELALDAPVVEVVVVVEAVVVEVVVVEAPVVEVVVEVAPVVADESVPAMSSPPQATRRRSVRARSRGGADGSLDRIRRR